MRVQCVLPPGYYCRLDVPRAFYGVEAAYTTASSPEMNLAAAVDDYGIGYDLPNMDYALGTTWYGVAPVTLVLPAGACSSTNPCHAFAYNADTTTRTIDVLGFF